MNSNKNAPTGVAAPNVGTDKLNQLQDKPKDGVCQMEGYKQEEQ